ncbi:MULTISPECIES: hypothetical protein [Streptomyces]|uniref:Lipoprotein n=2 Tax=Streptomyces TaxID=1883 RepID=A0AA89THN3_STRCU|nr:MULTISPECIES: hypothetical protein [Streptomyces]MBB5813056.1 hypothetical protein [Streptomyces collinus]MEC7055947.1 hypothetical protein [Streptomyces violaceochromogenes]WMX66180.1 hypothetical protein RFN52_23575 [Streptomyces collinus]GHC69576.1 hypothetical protein GCM10010309_36930 [Streptomyces violaceochromogenes]
MKRAALAVVSVLALTSALTACSGGEDKPSAAPTTPKAKQITPAQRLAKAIVTEDDLPGYNVSELEAEYAFAKSSDELTVDRPGCAPLALAMNQLPLGEPRADLTRSAGAGYGKESTYITLASYEPAAEAESLLAGLAKAVPECRDGFTAKAGKNTTDYESVTAEKGTTSGSVAFRSTMTFRGVSHTLRTEAVRDGDVLAVYFSVNGFAIADSTRPSDAKMPANVVKAQNSKLAK